GGRWTGAWARGAGVLLGVVAVVGIAAAEPPIVRIDIVGNVRVEEDAIRVHLESQPGKPFDRDVLDKGIPAVFALGFFHQVTAEQAAEGKGIVLTFRVKERPLVRAVEVEGTEEVKKEEVEGALRIRPHTILDPGKAREGIEAAKKLYAEKGYLDADISYTTSPVGENEVDVAYKVTEGPLVRIAATPFAGNHPFTPPTLRATIPTTN